MAMNTRGLTSRNFPSLLNVPYSTSGFFPSIFRVLESLGEFGFFPYQTLLQALAFLHSFLELSLSCDDPGLVFLTKRLFGGSLLVGISHNLLQRLIFSTRS